MHLGQTLAAPIATPFLVWMFASQYLPVDGWAMFMSIVSAVVAASKGAIVQSGLLIFAVVVLHNGLGYLLGFFAARAADLSLAKREAIAIEVGMQNSGLGAVFGNRLLPAAVPSAISPVWRNISGALLSNWFSGRLDDGDKAKGSQTA